MKLNLCAFDIFFKVIADILKKNICFALVQKQQHLFCLGAKTCCILFPDVFPLNLSSNNLYSEYILTICFGYNIEQYFSIISEDVSDRLAPIYALRINLLK